MNKDIIYRLVGVFFLLISVVLIYISGDFKIESILAGFFLGVGLVFLSSGENAFAYWKRNKEDDN